MTPVRRGDDRAGKENSIPFHTWGSRVGSVPALTRRIPRQVFISPSVSAQNGWNETKYKQNRASPSSGKANHGVGENWRCVVYAGAESLSNQIAYMSHIV